MKTIDKFYMTTYYSPYSCNEFETLEEAETSARSTAWSTGRDQHILATVAIARAPEDINTVKIETV